MAVVLNSNIQLFQQQLEQHIETTLEAVGNFVLSKAALKVPWDHGALSGSLSYEVDMSDKSVSIGTNMEYAIYQEFGTGIYAENGRGRKGGWVYIDPDTNKEVFTRGNKPHHFLKPAGEDHIDEIKAMIASYMRM